MSTAEHFFECPFCFEQISMVLEVEPDQDQTYIEDCEVCCHPIKIAFQAQDGEIVSFQAEKAQ